MGSDNQNSNPGQISRTRIILSGFITGAISRTLVHPIDTIKARMQVIKSRVTFSELHNYGILKSGKRTFQAEGIRGFYRGLGINIVGGAPAGALYFLSYDQSKKYLSNLTGQKNSFFVGFFSGIVAEVISCILFVPIDVIKERQQVMSLLKTYHYKNSIDAIRQIHGQEGLRSLYKAYGATILSFGPFTGISLALYDKLKYWFGYEDKAINFFQSMLLSGISGIVASAVTNPIDVVKVRMQVQRAERAGNAPLSAGRFGYKNSLHGMKELFVQEGFLALFKGLTARILFGVMNAGLHLSINDYVKYTLLANFDKSN